MGANNNGDRPSTNSVAVVYAVMDHVAQEESDRAPTTPEEARWARRVRQQLDVQLAELRRRLTPTDCKPKRPPAIPEEIRTLDREGLLARLEVLRQYDGVRYAHLDLTGLSTEDLRQMVAAILEPPMDDESSR
jgi:hypothetical protein